MSAKFDKTYSLYIENICKKLAYLGFQSIESVQSKGIFVPQHKETHNQIQWWKQSRWYDTSFYSLKYSHTYIKHNGVGVFTWNIMLISQLQWRY